MGSRKAIIKKLEKFKEDLKNNIHVEKIIFFGSMASGKPHKDSDIDLIIVSEDFRGKKFRYRAIGFYNYWDINSPVDFLCYTPEEFKKLKKQITIVKDAIETGIEI